MKMTDLKRFKELEKENSQLKKMLADKMLKIQVLEETLKKVVSASSKMAGRAEGFTALNINLAFRLGRNGFTAPSRSGTPIIVEPEKQAGYWRC